MDCCELVKLALYVIAGAFGVILILLAMFFGYNLRLDKRTLKLEKKNGHEQHQIDELKKEIESLKETSQRLKNKNENMSALPKEKLNN